MLVFCKLCVASLNPQYTGFWFTKPTTATLNTGFYVLNNINQDSIYPFPQHAWFCCMWRLNIDIPIFSKFVGVSPPETVGRPLLAIKESSDCILALLGGSSTCWWTENQVQEAVCHARHYLQRNSATSTLHSPAKCHWIVQQWVKLCPLTGYY